MITAPALVARTYVPTGSVWDIARNRDITSGSGKLLEQDLTASLDRPGLWQQWEMIAGVPVDHGTVADEAAMLGLHTFGGSTASPSLRYIAPGDSCLRTDDPGWRWHCLSGHGLTLSDWERRPLAAALAEIAAGAPVTHTHEQADVSGLTTDLAALATAIAGKQAALANASTLGKLTDPSGVLLYDGAPLAGGGSAWAFTPGPHTFGPGTYPFSSFTDTTGLFSQLGIVAGGGTWTNPVTAGVCAVVFSTGWTSATPAYLVDRNATGYPYASSITAWVGVDIGAGRTIAPTCYVLQGGPYAGRYPPSFVFEGSNDVAANTTAGFAAATWTAIDTRSGDATFAPGVVSAKGKFLCNPLAAYRWFRWRCTGVDGLGGTFFTITEIELYDTTTLPAPNPGGGWATDGAGHYVPYYG